MVISRKNDFGTIGSEVWERLVMMWQKRERLINTRRGFYPNGLIKTQN